MNNAESPGLSGGVSGSPPGLSGGVSGSPPGLSGGVSGSPPGLSVSVENLSGIVVEHEQRWATVAQRTLIDEGVSHGHLDIAFVDSAVMGHLNAEHMGESKPTDVLAFPMDAPSASSLEPDNHDASVDLVGPPVHLGDIVICPETATAQAPSHSGTIESEYCLLTIHAVLHILGHDHTCEDERLLMQRRERFHMSVQGYRHPVTDPSC